MFDLFLLVFLLGVFLVLLGHGYSVDWWSLGILIYEMTAGFPPFTAETHIKLYEKIVAGKFRFPSHFTKAIRDILSNLIVVDKTCRYILRICF